MRLDDGQIEVIDDDMARVLRAKTGAERLAIGIALFNSGRKALTFYLRNQHPDWTDEQVTREVARRLSHGSI